MLPSPLPPWLMKAASKKLFTVGAKIAQGLPNLKSDLLQAQFEASPVEYISNVLVVAVFYGFLVFALFLVLGLIVKVNVLPMALMVGLVLFSFTLLSFLFYPRTKVSKRMRALDAQLVPALRHLLIEIKSGVPLFNAMVAISEGYGEVSNEFRRIVRDINTGMKETDALTAATERNPSFQFRRSIWQITNALKAGSEVANALDVIIQDLTQEQITAIRRYGQELNPWTMLYMVAAVIIPTMGVTFLVVITSFTGTAIPKSIFLVIIGAVFGFQLFFLNFVKTKRPPI